MLKTEALMRFDATVGDNAGSIRNETLNEIARWFDWIGSTTGYAVITVITVIAFLIGRRVAAAGLTLLSVAGAYALNTLVKMFVERPRPDIEPLFAADGFSFPSGNATIAVALFGYAAVVMTGVIVRSRSWTTVVSCAAAALILLIGAFRVYAGVHYASDIIAGYLLGAAWLFIVLSLHRS
ncbi:phosphatase PAP2 family protein [Paenibacillus alkalitolerans]|uniref:phosphatase PAP2 family protein n=1 Tax=Paenibacillus alkalitolerans TaxID=2799335 RepID=UPI0018F3561C|nr:phosphatase PAP2 family protein [Paenibacillus alkalitolerans]